MLILFVLSYLLGSIPWSWVITRLHLKIDIRNVGSGNAGATNVYRVDKKLALLVLILDIAKSAALLKVCSYYGLEKNTVCLYGLFAVIGHVFPIWLKFRGGKGVATALGVIMVVNPKVLVIFLVAWTIFFLPFRYPSISSIMAIVASAIGMFFLESFQTFLVFLAIATIVIAKHKTNIKRLIKREEYGL